VEPSAGVEAADIVTVDAGVMGRRPRGEPAWGWTPEDAKEPKRLRFDNRGPYIRLRPAQLDRQEFKCLGQPGGGDAPATAGPAVGRRAKVRDKG